METIIKLCNKSCSNGHQRFSVRILGPTSHPRRFSMFPSPIYWSATMHNNLPRSVGDLTIRTAEACVSPRRVAFDVSTHVSTIHSFPSRDGPSPFLRPHLISHGIIFFFLNKSAVQISINDLYTNCILSPTFTCYRTHIKLPPIELNKGGKRR